MHFKKVYKAPFNGMEFDNYISNYVWSKNGTMSFTFATDDQDVRRAFIEALNHKDPSGDNETHNFELRNSTDIISGGKFIAMVRGWGNLIGVGGLNLTAEDAAKIQDEFAKWAVWMLNNYYEVK